MRQRLLTSAARVCIWPITLSCCRSRREATAAMAARLCLGGAFSTCTCDRAWSQQPLLSVGLVFSGNRQESPLWLDDLIKQAQTGICL